MENRSYKIERNLQEAEERSRRAYLPYLTNAEIEGMKQDNERSRNMAKFTNHIH